MWTTAACAVVLASCWLARAAAVCDAGVVGRINEMNKDDDKLAGVIHQLPGNYEIVSIFKGGKKTTVKTCLPLSIKKENDKTRITFGSLNSFAYPLSFQDGKLVYSGATKQKKRRNEKTKGGKADKGGKEDEAVVTISYYIVEHSPEAVSFYACSDKDKEPALAFTAVPATSIGKAGTRAAVESIKLSQIGVTGLSSVPLCRDVKKKRPAKNAGGQKGTRAKHKGEGGKRGKGGKRKRGRGQGGRRVKGSKERGGHKGHRVSKGRQRGKAYERSKGPKGGKSYEGRMGQKGGKESEGKKENHD